MHLHALATAGSPPQSVYTVATVTLDKVGAGFAITTVHLNTTAKVPGLDEQKFQTIAAEAKANCPVSKALNAKITMEARLAS